MKEKKDFQGKTLRKIFEYLKQSQRIGEHKTPTELATELNLSFDSVKECISFLEEIKQVRVITNGHTSLIEVLEGEKYDTNHDKRY